MSQSSWWATFTNSAGLVTSTSISVLVGDDLSEQGPILAVSPAAISLSLVAC